MTEISVKYTHMNNEEFDGSFYTQSKEEILPGETKLVSTGVTLEIPVGHEGAVFRSANLIPFEIVNLPGTIDSDYRKEIKMILYNNSKSSIVLEKGEKIGLLKINKFINLGKPATKGSAGTDLKSAEDLNLKGWQAIRLQWIPQSQHHLHIQYRGRSGLALKGLKTCYYSDLKEPIILAHSKENFKISEGDRIIQAVATLFERKTTTFFPLYHYQSCHTEKIISFDTRLKDCTIEFQVPNIPNTNIEILNNPSCGGIIVLRIITEDGTCFLEGLFAKIFFYSHININWLKGELSISERGAFGSTGV